MIRFLGIPVLPHLAHSAPSILVSLLLSTFQILPVPIPAPPPCSPPSPLDVIRLAHTHYSDPCSKVTSSSGRYSLTTLARAAHKTLTHTFLCSLPHPLLTLLLSFDILFIFSPLVNWNVPDGSDLACCVYHRISSS